MTIRRRKRGQGLMLTMKLWRFHDELIGWIITQCPTIERGKQDGFTGSNGFRFASSACPALSASMLYIQGTDRGNDRNAIYFKAYTVVDAKRIARSLREALKEWNTEVVASPESDNDDCEVVV